MMHRYGKGFVLCCLLACMNSCSDVVVNITGKEGETTCSDNDKTLYTYHKTSNSIETSYCSNCSPDNIHCMECEIEKEYCQNNDKHIGDYIKCDNNGLYDETSKKTCSTSCNSERTKCGECVNGSIERIGPQNGNQYRYCKDGGWVEDKCESGKYLDDTRSCEDAPQCNSNEKPNRPVICIKGEWILIESEVCNQNKTRCEHDIESTCLNNKWTNETVCPNGCDDVTQKCKIIEVKPEKQCETGHKVCKKDESIEYNCKDHTWVKTVCEYGCANERDCAVKGNQTVPSDKCTTDVCSGDTLMVCKDGVATPQTCTLGCDASTNKCKTGENTNPPAGNKCTADVCSGDTLMICKDGVATPQTCTLGCDASTNKCKTGENTNPPAGNKCTADVCKDENTLIKCKDGVESTENCVNGCENNACKEGGSTNPDDKCTADKCDGNVSCKIDSECGDCLNDDTKCELDEQTDKFYKSKCVDGVWQKAKESCKNGCNTDKTKCAPCSPECKNNMFQLCEGDDFGPIFPCPETSTCNSDGTACTCSQNDQSVCIENSDDLDDHYQWTCTNNEWVPKQCPNGCDATKNACKESPVEPLTNCNCINNDIVTLICKGETVKELYYCYHSCDNNKCDSKTPDSENAPESSTCLNVKGESGSGIRCTKEYGCYWCRDGNGDETSCTSDNECGECLNDDTRCNINKMEVCKNGKWEHKYYCAGKCENNQCNTLSSFSKNNNNGMLCMGYPANFNKKIPDLLGIQIEHTDNGDIVNQNCIQRYENFLGKPFELSKCEDGCECANVKFSFDTLSPNVQFSPYLETCQTNNIHNTYQYCYQEAGEAEPVTGGVYQPVLIKDKLNNISVIISAFIYHNDNNNANYSYICDPSELNSDLNNSHLNNNTYLSYCEEMVGDCQKPNTDKLNGLENCRIEKCP